MIEPLKIGDIVEFEHLHLKDYPKYYGVVVEISGEYCYVYFFDKGITMSYHHTGLTILSSANDVSQ